MASFDMSGIQFLKYVSKLKHGHSGFVLFSAMLAELYSISLEIFYHSKCCGIQLILLFVSLSAQRDLKKLS